VRLSIFQNIFSYIYPVKVIEAFGKTTPILTLYRYQRRWQLSASTVLYSDGAAYRPLATAFKYLRTELKKKQNMLVLGGGLGSAIAILHKLKMPIHSILVEIDPQIVTWGKEIIEEETQYPCEWLCADVQTFVEEHKSTYDLIILDVFQDRVVPHFVTGIPFLQQCHKLLNDPNSVLVFNYIINNNEHWETDLLQIQSVFHIEHMISIDINRIMILRKSV
jgi:spermidine synthase